METHRHVRETPTSFVPGVIVDLRLSFHAFCPKDDTTFKLSIVLHSLALINNTFAKVCRLSLQCNLVITCFMKEASKALSKVQRLQVERSSKIRKRGVAFTDDEGEADEVAGQE